MPTIFSHAIFATLVGKAALTKTQKFFFWLIVAVCAMVPDADVISFSLNAIRGGMFSHRGITHSITFALILGAVVAFFVEKYLKTKVSFLKLFAFFSLVTLSHPLLDMLTAGGSGVALFAPLSNERFFFPWRPIEVSPIGVRFFSSRGIEVIFSEIIWVWLPAFLIFGVLTAIRKFKSPNDKDL